MMDNKATTIPTLSTVIDMVTSTESKSENCVLRFCPYCANLLVIETNLDTRFIYKCQTCPYDYHITQPILSTHTLQRKQVDDVLGGEDAWKNVDQTDARCPKCKNDRAFYMQIQTRSADEPMTIFYKCTNFNCSYRWKQ